MSSLLLIRDSLRLDTREKNHIENDLNREAPTEGIMRKVADLKKDYPTARHRPTQPSAIYNCHGLTFAARRTGISKSAEVQKILNEDGYVKIERSQISIGDIAIYQAKDTNEIEHSGIIVEVGQFGPRILSKWGQCHEVIHFIAECPYDAAQVTFWRIMR